MTVTRGLGDGHPLVDGTPIKLTCIAFRDENYSVYNFADVGWTGVKYSLWITQSEIKRSYKYIQRTLTFRPCLEYHAGEYTCHLTVKDIFGYKFLVNKTIKLESKYMYHVPIYGFKHCIL